MMILISKYNNNTVVVNVQIVFFMYKFYNRIFNEDQLIE